MLRPSRGGHEQFNAANAIEDGLRLSEFGRARRYVEQAVAEAAAAVVAAAAVPAPPARLPAGEPVRGVISDGVLRLWASTAVVLLPWDDGAVFRPTRAVASAVAGAAPLGGRYAGWDKG